MSLVQTGIKRAPCSQFYCWIFNVVGLFFIFYLFFFPGGPGHLVQIHGIMDSSKYQQFKKAIPDGLC